MKNRTIFWLGALQLLACTHQSGPKHYTTNKYSISSDYSIYLNEAMRSKEVLCINSNGTFNGDAWLFFHAYDISETGAATLTNQFAGNCCYNTAAKELTLADSKNEFKMTRGIVRWSKDTVLLKVKSSNLYYVNASVSFALTKVADILQ